MEAANSHTKERLDAIHGLDSDIIDNLDPESKKNVDEGSEIISYFIINEIGGFIWRMNHDMADGRIEKEHHTSIDKDIKRMQDLQLYAISQLIRFGVDEPFVDGHGSPQYWAWFRWWDAYIKGISNDEWRRLDLKLKQKEDVSGFRPEGDWRDNVAQEEENLKKAEEFRKKMGI